ncbi:MAG: tetratricopeptide repeat protein [Acidimicrobiales bacterium]
MAAIDVNDATFETDVLVRSDDVPVVVDLWAPWCGPCKTLGPIIEKVVDETEGKVVLAKINVDDNPRASSTFQVQSIPAVFAVRDRKVINGFIGAQGEAAVREFVTSLLPTAADDELSALLDSGDEASLRAVLERDAGHEGAVVALAELLVGKGEGGEALALLERIPETPDTRRIAALARVGDEADVDTDEMTAKLDDLLARVKGDDDARQELVDLLEVLGPDDPRTAAYRRKLTSALY